MLSSLLIGFSKSQSRKVVHRILCLVKPNHTDDKAPNLNTVYDPIEGMSLGHTEKLRRGETVLESCGCWMAGCLQSISLTPPLQNFWRIGLVIQSYTKVHFQVLCLEQS